MAKKKNSRLVAAEIVCRWLEDQSFPDRQIAALRHDHAFVLEVVNGVVRNRNIFEWLEKQWIRSEPKPFFQAVLWVGLYQLLFMDNVEQYAAHVYSTVLLQAMVCCKNSIALLLECKRQVKKVSAADFGNKISL